VSVKTPVYLDHHATTPLDPRVLAVLERVQRDHYGNPASSWHAQGWAAARLVDNARAQVADLVGAEPSEIIFTSGATEAANLALLGSCGIRPEGGGHLVTTNLEHEAVAGPLEELGRRGWRVTVVACRPDGRVDPRDIESVLEKDTVLVAVMAAQNEIGTVQPVTEIGEICKARGVIFFSDAAQAAGRVPLDVRTQGVDLMALSAHKMYGPKGVGALFVRRRDPRVPLSALQFGGGQERGLRPGTLNVPGIAAFGEACRVAALEIEVEAARLKGLGDHLLRVLKEKLGGVHLNGSAGHRLPGSLNLSFEGVRAHRLLGALTELAVSSSSACSSASTGPSRILKSLGVPDELAMASLRLGLGRGTTLEEVDFAVETITTAVGRLRKEG